MTYQRAVGQQADKTEVAEGDHEDIRLFSSYMSKVCTLRFKPLLHGTDFARVFGGCSELWGIFDAQIKNRMTGDRIYPVTPVGSEAHLIATSNLP